MIAFCPDCGKSIETTFKFCPHCGKPLPTGDHEGPQTPPGSRLSSFRDSRRGSTSSESTPKKVKWSSCVTSSPSSLSSGGSGSEDSPSACEKPKGSRGRPSTPKSSPQATRISPQTLKRSRATTSLQALPTGMVLTDNSKQKWKLGSLQTRNDQGILYEGTLHAQVDGCWAG